MMNSHSKTRISEGFVVSENSQEITISYRWLKNDIIIHVLVCVFWNCLSPVWYSLGLTILNLSDTNPFRIIFILLPILLFLIGIGSIYYTIASFLNKTTITANRYGLTIDIQPIPYFFGATQLDKKDIKKFYVLVEKVSTKSDYYYTYFLTVINIKNISQQLLPFVTLEEAQYLENKLNSYYKIENLPVEGEFPKAK